MGFGQGLNSLRPNHPFGEKLARDFCVLIQRNSMDRLPLWALHLRCTLVGFSRLTIPLHGIINIALRLAGDIAKAKEL